MPKLPDPVKTNARWRTRNALYAGILKRPDTCEACGQTPKRAPGAPHPIESHHDDYTKPMEIRWLCRPCHQRHHAAERRAAKQAA